MRDVKETREAGIKFYRIPQSEAKRRLWLNAINRKDFHPTTDTVICSQHFVGSVCRICLKREAVIRPALYLNQSLDLDWFHVTISK